MTMTFSDFKGKVAVVTGASGGVGYRIAEKLAEGGAHVVLNGRSEENGVKALANLRAFTGEAASARFVVGDCSKYEQAAHLCEEAAKVTGAIDIVVSSGAQGAVRPMPFEKMTGEELVLAHNSRFFARVNPLHAAIPFMRDKGGSMIMVGTDAGRHPTPGESVVGAFGAGVILMTKALAKELARYHIRVNSVSLTLTSDTPSWDRIFGEQTFQTNLFAKAKDRFPFGRAPNAEEVARVATFLASEEACQVTGQTVSVNGGLSFGGW
jgi:3-oxoacyl-[acyl-carrier protein] reductase